MREKKGKFTVRGSKVLNVVLIGGVFALTSFCFYISKIDHSIRLYSLAGTSFLFLFLYSVFGKIYDAFTISLFRISQLVYSQALSFLVSDAVMYFVLCLMQMKLLSLVPVVVEVALQLVVSVVWCTVAHRWYFANFPAKRSLVVYDMREGLEQLITEYGLDKKFNVESTITIEECVMNMEVLSDYKTVFLSGIHSSERNAIMKYCIMHRIPTYVIPRIGDAIMLSAKTVHMFHFPVMRVSYYDPSPFYLAAKRAFDIVVSALALVILSPVFLITAIAIKVTDGGPVFYMQERLTKDRKKFMIHKFRSMRVDAEKDGVARLSTGENDDRITPVGHIIRKVRIDELPQLIDIISGNLSIVGPRPEREEIALQYEAEMPEFALRLQTKAGLTGYAQVYGKYNSTPYDKLLMDLLYISKPSFLEDLRICFATVKILFIPESTEGVDEGSLTAMNKKG